MRLRLLVLLCLAATIASADPIDDARADARALAKSRNIPGMSVAVAVDGKVVWSEGFGLADVEQNVPAAASTRYRLGSVSKLFTAAIAARLAEQGKLDLDAPVSKYVPAYTRPVTSRQLAGHLGGVRHYLPADPIFAGKTYKSLEDGLSIFANDELLFAPGSGYHYTSYGYNLLGVVIEHASGKTFGAALADEVAGPLKLATLALDDNARIVPGRTAFYDIAPDGSIRNAAQNDSSYKWPSGGLLASAEDVVRFASAHLQPGYLNEATLRIMFTPQQLADGKATNVGLGWRIDRKDGTAFYHHGGTILGGRAFVVVLPRERVAVAVLANMLVRFGEDEVLAIARRFVR